MTTLLMKRCINFLLLTLAIGVASGCTKNLNAPVASNGNGSTSTINDVITSTLTTTPTDLDVSTWKTYWNEEYGFEFKYPASWVLSDSAYADLKLSYYTTDKDKIKKYAESLMSTIEIDVDEGDLFKLLQDLQYKTLGTYATGDDVFIDHGMSKTFYVASWINIGEGPVLILNNKNETGSKEVFIEYGKRVLHITVLSHPQEFSEGELIEILETFEFTK